MVDGWTRVTVVTGFLGAGKSTLVRAWLSELTEASRGETAVIVNERGDVGIDGELLARHVARLREITGGCVCCTSRAELVSALAELSESEPRPKRILVETSGAASPAFVIRAIGMSEVPLRLDGVVAVLDATRLRESMAFDLTVEQLGFADVVVLTHADRLEASPSDLEDAAREVRGYAPAAVTVTSRHGRVDGSFTELLSRRSSALHLPEVSAAHRDIQAVSLIVEGELDEGGFGEWMESDLAAVEVRLLRLKGILAIEGVDRRIILQGVGSVVEVEVGEPWGDAPRRSRMVVLGLDLDAAALEAGFAGCAARLARRA
jgi:G3E family GTPase